MSDDMNISVMLADQLDRLFGETVNRDLFIAVESGQPATQLWQELEQLGITSALVSEAAGGAGLCWEDIEPSLKTIGSHGAPVPIAETLIAHWALTQVGLNAPEGSIAVSSQCFALNDDQTLSGCDSAVSWAPDCQHVIAIAEGNGERKLALLAIDKEALKVNQTIGRDPQATLELNATPAIALATADQIGSLGLLPYLAIVRSVQIGGALEQLLALCVEYGNTREQFGRPIGKFQAIQHAIAELASHTAAAQAAGLFACRQIDSGNALNGAMVAKTRAGQAAGRGAEIAHQVFGAIGFTDEHSLHYLTRRLWQWRSEAGSDFWWAEQLGEQVISNGGEALWPSIVD